MLDYNYNNSLKINNNCEKIFHLGESHSLAFANCSIKLKDKLFQVKPLITFGLKAWHLSQNTQNRFKSIFTQRLKSIPDNSKVMISIGEIDCRENEGIIYNHIETGQSIEKIIEITITGYINFVKELIDQKNLDAYFFSVPAPVFEAKRADQNSKLNNQKLRAQVVKKFNETLQQKVRSISSKFIDTYSLTLNKDGFSNNKFHIDGIHLKPNILESIQDKIK